MNYDVEADMLVFYRLEIDIDQDEYGGLTAERLFSLIERLGAYEGAVAARIALLREEQKKHNPSHQAIEQGAKETDLAEVAEMGDHETV